MPRRRLKVKGAPEGSSWGPSEQVESLSRLDDAIAAQSKTPPDLQAVLAGWMDKAQQWVKPGDPPHPILGDLNVDGYQWASAVYIAYLGKWPTTTRQTGNSGVAIYFPQLGQEKWRPPLVFVVGHPQPSWPGHVIKEITRRWSQAQLAAS